MTNAINFYDEMIRLVKDGANILARRVGDGAISLGTPTTLTSSLAHFAAADAGKTIYVAGAGAAGATLKSVISVVVNASTVTIANAAALAVSGAMVIYSNEDAIGSALSRAIEQYGKKRSLELSIDLPGDGTGEFSIADITGFDFSFSGDPLIEFPISTTGSGPNFLDRREWGFYLKPGRRVIRLVGLTPAQTDQVRFTFKTPHVVDLASSTIPSSDFYSVAKKGAAEMCKDLSLHYSQTVEGNFGGVDMAVYQTKADQYEKRGKRLDGEFNAEIGIAGKDDPMPAASVTKNWDTSSSMGGDRLTHRRRFN